MYKGNRGDLKRLNLREVPVYRANKGSLETAGSGEMEVPSERARGVLETAGSKEANLCTREI